VRPREERAVRNQRRDVSRQRERELRRAMTEAERVLWAMVRNRFLARWKFRRQHRVGSFFVDFFCAELSLAVELDGEPHFTDEGRAADEIRSRILGRLGVRVVRYENREVVADPTSVEADLRRILAERAHELRTAPPLTPAPLPARRGEGEERDQAPHGEPVAAS
jgi:very-short-patch-repair endonuclease